MNKLLSSVLSHFILFFLVWPGLLFAQPDKIRIVSIDTKLQPNGTELSASIAGQSPWAIATAPTGDLKIETVAGQFAPQLLPIDSGQLVWTSIVVPQARFKLADNEMWYRLPFQIKNIGDQQLALMPGSISDRDRVYLNGKLIGFTGCWNATDAQAYDRVRIYPLPMRLLRLDGINYIHIQVQGYYKNQLGIVSGTPLLGTHVALLEKLYFQNLIQFGLLMSYFTLGSYFLFQFLRSFAFRENLYFALFVFGLVLYHFLRTQLRFSLGLDFQFLKKIEYSIYYLLTPAVYYFVRYSFRPSAGHYRRLHDNIMYGFLGIAVIISLISGLGPDLRLADSLNPFYTIFVFPVFCLSLLVLLGRAWNRNTDSRFILLGTLIVIAAVIYDYAVAYALIQSPRIVIYVFTIFVIIIGFVLVNRVARLHHEQKALNSELQATNRSIRRFVPREFLERMRKTSVLEVQLGNHVQERMAVLFTDIRSFTTLSESMTVADNFHFLNSYLRRMEPLIHARHGFVDKYIGDAIMALFAEEERLASASTRAVQTAIAMRHELDAYNLHRAGQGFVAIDFGVGIHSGNLMLGTVGSDDRLETTVIGDTVNVAARLESLTPYYKAGILITEECLELVEKSDLLTREIDLVRLKGRRQPVSLFEIYNGDPEAMRTYKQETRPELQKALILYREGKWSAARTLFINLQSKQLSIQNEFESNLNDGDHLVSIYLHRLGTKMAQAPQDFDPVYTFDVK